MGLEETRSPFLAIAGDIGASGGALGQGCGLSVRDEVMQFKDRSSREEQPCELGLAAP